MYWIFLNTAISNVYPGFKTCWFIKVWIGRLKTLDMPLFAYHINMYIKVCILNRPYFYICLPVDFMFLFILLSQYLIVLFYHICLILCIEVTQNFSFNSGLVKVLRYLVYLFESEFIINQNIQLDSCLICQSIVLHK